MRIEDIPSVVILNIGIYAFAALLGGLAFAAGWLVSLTSKRISLTANFLLWGIVSALLWLVHPWVTFFMAGIAIAVLSLDHKMPWDRSDS